MRRARRAERHHPKRKNLLGRGYFKRLGPGLITGAADDDPSGIGTYSQVGAAFGLALVWSSLFVAPLAAGVQELAARLGLVSGEGLGVLIRRRFPRVIVAAAVTLVAFANIFNIAADLQAMGAATAAVVPLGRPTLTIAFAVAIVVLQVSMPYHRYSRVLRWLALSLGAYVLVLLMVDVQWGEVLRALFVPRLPNSREQVVGLMAVVGTTISPYLFFWQASEEVEEQTEEGESAGREEEPALEATHLKAMRVDVIGGMGSAVFIAFAIIVSAAMTLHPAGITRIDTANQAAEALKPVAGGAASTVFALGIIGLGLLAVPVLAGATAYAVAEIFGWSEGLAKDFWHARGFYMVIIASTILGLGLGLLGLDPMRGLYYAAILNGVAAPPLIVLMMVLARDRETMGEHRSGRLSLVVTGIAVAIMVVLAGTAVAWTLAA